MKTNLVLLALAAVFTVGAINPNTIKHFDDPQPLCPYEPPTCPGFSR